ncbi:MAG: hypothetical protein ABR601_08515 [Parasphingopyxis sp.]|nr:hypothetical protein [Sphingomonadales bacterium]
MGDILIRKLDDKVVAAWKKRAAANGRSLQAELHEELSKQLMADEKARALEIAARSRASADISKMEGESWEWIREDRDSR